MSEIKKTIQKNIALYRNAVNLTQKDLAERLGIPPTNLASWEQGKSMPDIDTLFSICAILGVDILTVSGFEPPAPKHHHGDGMKSALSDVHTALDTLTKHSVKVGSALTESLSSDEQQLLADYHAFNDEGKEKVRDYVADLKDNPKYKKCTESVLEQEA